MTRFGLAIWIFTETGSTIQLSLLVLAGSLPGVLMTPFVGSLVDRWDRRIAMIVSDAGSAVGTLAIAVLLLTGSLETWHLFPALAFSSAFGAFQFPAYGAAVTMLVPKDQYGRASGMVQLANSVGSVVAPIAAGLLVVSTGLTALFVIDFVTFAVAVGTLLIVRFPNPENLTTGRVTPVGLLREAFEGLRFVLDRRGLLILLLTFGLVNLSFSALGVLLIPLLLTVTTEAIAGLAVSVSAFGLIGGGLIMSVWGGSTNRLRDLFGALVIMGSGLVITGLQPIVGLIVIGITLTHLALPIASGSSQALWQAKVPPALQGRVFAVRQMIAFGAMPLGFLTAGVLAEKVFDPAFDEGAWLANLAGGVFGTGPGRGIGFLLTLMGLAVVVVSVTSWRSKPIQHLDEEVPDIDVVTHEPEPSAA
jgi:MFS family permease